MKKLLLVLLVVILSVMTAYSGDWWYKQTCSRTTAAEDTIVGTSPDTCLITLSGSKKHRIGVLLVTRDTAGNTAEDSMYVRIYGNASNQTKTGDGWSLMTTLTCTGTDVTVATNKIVYIKDDATYIYNAPYLMASVLQCEGAADGDSARYKFYWIWEDE